MHNFLSQKYVNHDSKNIFLEQSIIFGHVTLIRLPILMKIQSSGHIGLFLLKSTMGEKKTNYVCKFWNEYSFVGVEKVNLSVRRCMIPII
jgi:hypothetical protein